jgi:hypothetical protein
MKFFKLPKYATIKALLAAAVIQSIFGMVMYELCKRGDLDWHLIYGDWLARTAMFGGVIFVPLGVAAYWFPRAASLAGVCLYAAFLAAQASRSISLVKSFGILNVPMVILLIFAFACAFRRPALTSQLHPSEGAK